MATTTVETAFTVETQRATFDSLALDCGVTLKDVNVAYETYGELNAERSNAILVLHAAHKHLLAQHRLLRQVPHALESHFEAGSKSIFFRDRWLSAQIFDNLVGRESGRSRKWVIG